MTVLIKFGGGPVAIVNHPQIRLHESANVQAIKIIGIEINMVNYPTTIQLLTNFLLASSVHTLFPVCESTHCVHLH